MAAFHSLVHRAVNIPMDKEDFNMEIKIIKQITKNDGYNIEIINKLIERHKNKKIMHLIVKLIKINTFVQNTRQNYQVF